MRESECRKVDAIHQAKKLRAGDAFVPTWSQIGGKMAAEVREVQSPGGSVQGT